MLLGACQQATAGVAYYRGQITLQPATAQIAEVLTIRFAAPAQGADRLELYLNKDLAISSISCRACLSHQLGPVNERTRTRLLIIPFRQPLQPGKTADIKFEAHGTLTDVSSDADSFSSAWVELSISSGWYPYQLEDRDFRFDLRVKLPAAYKLAGNAKVSGGKGKWRLRQKDGARDIDLVAAPEWTTDEVEAQSLRIRIIAVNVPRPIKQRFAQQASSAVEAYTEWFGRAAARNLTIVLNPHQGGSSYARPGYISLVYSPNPAELDRLLFILAHEVAHFWWSRAPSGAWENWLNESFAEYSALMYMRKSQGEAVFRELMLQHVARARSQPPIWGVRPDRRGYVRVIYAKGAVRLLQLEGMLGQEKFRRLLTTLVRKRVNTTQAFLEELQAESSPEIRSRFEQLLKDQRSLRVRRASRR
jgi:hypothetical protein